MSKSKQFSDQIRDAINRSGMTRYAICKRLNFSESVMSKFMSGKCGLSIDTLDRLAALLDFRIVPGPRVGQSHKSAPKPRAMAKKTSKKGGER